MFLPGIMPQSQVSTLAATLPTPQVPDAESAQVIIPSPLKLTLEQEKRLLHHCATRFQELSSELGRYDYESPTYAASPVATLQRALVTFFGKRHLANLIIQQRMDWRAYVLGGIYAETNIHLPITARIVGQQVARANKTFFGTSPYFAVNGLSADSDILAADVDALAHHQLDVIGGISSNLETANQLAFAQGECVVKTSHHKLTSFFEAYRDVAVDASGEPFIAQDGDYIYKTDLFVPAQVPQMDQSTGLPVQNQDTGMPVMQNDPSGDMVLKRDMTTPMPEKMEFQSIKLDLRQVMQDKIEAHPIYYLDFMAPLNAPDLQQADMVMHCYNSKVIELADRYLRETWGDSPKDQIERVSRLVHQVQGGSAESKQAVGDKSRSELGEYNAQTTTGTARAEPVIGLVECWCWFDVFGDGVLRNIMVLTDPDGKIPVYYDYTNNLTADGQRPFDVIRINPVQGRWHGQGQVEKYYALQDSCDLLVNRAMFAESRAARVDFWDPSKTVEGQANPNMELNWGGTYRLKPGATASDVLTSVYLTNIKSANLKDLLQLVMQTMQAMSAVTNVNDAAMSGMDSAKLATGIRNLEASGDELFHQFITQLRPGIESVLRRALKILIQVATSSPAEQSKVTKFFDRISKRMMEINPARLADLDLDIELTLTTYDRQTRMTSAQMAYNMAADFAQRCGFPPEVVHQRLGPLVASFLRALQVRNADDIVAAIDPAMRLPIPPVTPSESGIPTPTNDHNALPL